MAQRRSLAHGTSSRGKSFVLRVLGTKPPALETEARDKQSLLSPKDELSRFGHIHNLIREIALFIITSYPFQTILLGIASRKVNPNSSWFPFGSTHSGGTFPYPHMVLLLATSSSFALSVIALVRHSCRKFPEVSLISLLSGDLILCGLLQLASTAAFIYAIYSAFISIDSILILSFMDLFILRIIAPVLIPGRSKHVNKASRIWSLFIAILAVVYAAITISPTDTDHSTLINLGFIASLVLLISSRFLNAFRSLVAKAFMFRRSSFLITPESLEKMYERRNLYIITGGNVALNSQQKEEWMLESILQTPAYDEAPIGTSAHTTMILSSLGGSFIAFPLTLMYFVSTANKIATFNSIFSINIWTLLAIVGFGLCSTVNDIYTFRAVATTSPDQYALISRIPCLVLVPLSILTLERVTTFTLSHTVCLVMIAYAYMAEFAACHRHMDCAALDTSKRILGERLREKFDRSLFDRVQQALPENEAKELAIEAALFNGDLPRWYEHRHLKPWYQREMVGPEDTAL